MAMPTDSEPTLESHLSKRTFTPLQANQTSYWQNYRKFYVSFLKSLYGAEGDAGERVRLRLDAEARRRATTP